MSTSTPPSPASPPSPRPQSAAQADESKLPQGHCRYILVVPELRGQRCGCAHFNLNRNTPGASCECGHLACYHVSNSQSPAMPGSHDVGVLEQRLQLLEKEHVELHQLRRDFMLLQEQMNQDGHRGQELIERVSELEDATERSRVDVDQQVREAYRNLGRAWESISELSHHRAATDDQLRRIQEHMHTIDSEIPQVGERQIELDAEMARISQRQLELTDINIDLEERIEELEALDGLEERVEALEDRISREDRGSATIEMRIQAAPTARVSTEGSLPPPSPRPLAADRNCSHQTTPTAATQQPMSPVMAAPARPIPFIRGIIPGSGHDPNELWTVHISLMPAATLPFPFERGTNAYKRCLSRGLHQMVPVSGTSARAFESAVKRAFSGFLHNHRWMPLKAEPCTADGLTGLPMLRQLDPSLVDQPYDLAFLLKNCAVRDSNGHIDSLYIAMRDKTISWYKLRKAPVYLEGLEASWNYDRILDSTNELVASSEEGSEDENSTGVGRPPAGDIVASLPSLKRAASEMSRSSSFGSSGAVVPTTAVTSGAEGEGSRSKMPRIHPLPKLVEIRRGVTTL